MSTDLIFYEQPINEHIRACLRLDYLFNEALYHVRGSSPWSSRNTLAAIADILNILERPDLKTKLAKELSRHLHNLKRLENTPNVDTRKLVPVLYELEELMDTLHATSGRIGKELRENEFVNTIRQRLSTPGGTSDFDMPAYCLWLHMPASERITQLTEWLSSFDVIRNTVNLLLKIVRQSALPQAKIASDGFFQMPLDPQAPCQLIRVQLATSPAVYPEISVGRHGISIRFIELVTSGARATQIKEAVTFDLTVCII